MPQKRPTTIHRTTIDMPQDLWVELKVAAARQRTTMKRLILDAVRALLKRARGRERG